MKFIVVDDDQITLFISNSLLKDVLKVEEVSTYQKAGDALRFLQCYNHPETVTVLLDFNMPVISGWDFLEFFSQFDESLKNRVQIYMVSSSISPADRARALRCPNVIAFISKPLTKNSIKEHFCNNAT